MKKINSLMQEKLQQLQSDYSSSFESLLDLHKQTVPDVVEDFRYDECEYSAISGVNMN